MSFNILRKSEAPVEHGVFGESLRVTAAGMGGPKPVEWPAVAIIALGAGLYLWCLYSFAIVGHSTPGPWDAAGPDRWLRNPIYIAALVIVIGEA